MPFEKVVDLMNRLAREMVPGNAVCVYLQGKKVLEYAAGYADLEAGTPMTGHELFNLYSSSKLTTVTAALQLYEQGLFLMSDPLYAYIPEFREMTVLAPDGHLTRAANPITVGHLFTMTAGMDYDLRRLDREDVQESTDGKMDTLEVVRRLAREPLAFEPGTRWQYSLCHDVLAGLVCAITGKKFRDYVRERIFEPLGIQNAFYHRTAAIENRMAAQYTYVPLEGEEITDPVEAQMSGRIGKGAFRKIDKSIGAFAPGEEYDSGGAGIVSSVPEYALLLAALAAGGKGLTGERILSPHTVRLMKANHLDERTAPFFPSTPHLAGYGYGLGVRTMVDPVRGGSNGSLGEFGWGGAAGSYCLVDTELELAVCYAHHMRNPQTDYFQPRLRNVIYACLDV